MKSLLYEEWKKKKKKKRDAWERTPRKITFSELVSKQPTILASATTSEKFGSVVTL